MNWHNVFVSAVAGAIAGAVATIISKKILKLLGKENSKWANIFHGIIFVAAIAISQMIVVSQKGKPTIDISKIESEILQMPAYQNLKKFEPEIYNRILSVVKTSVQNKQPIEQTISAGRAVIIETMGKKMPYASDATVIKTIRHGISVINLLHSKGGDACFFYIYPESNTAIDFSVFLDKDTIQKELDLASEIIVSTAGKKQKHAVITNTEADPLLRLIFSRLSKKYSQEDLISIQNPYAPGINKRKVCLIMADLYNEIIKLPEPKNSDLLRYISQQPQQ